MNSEHSRRQTQLIVTTLVDFVGSNSREIALFLHVFVYKARHFMVANFNFKLLGLSLVE